jgi:hypothetical protein
MDQCSKCELMGNHEACKKAECGKHDDWIVREYRSRIAALEAELAKYRLKWQTGKPPIDGWYWIHDPCCHKMARYDGRDFSYAGLWTFPDQWSGPIPLPEEG